MQLENKIVNFLGDSITEGVGASSYETNYVAYVLKKARLARANNYGISATTVAKQLHPTEWQPVDRDFCSRIAAMDKDADINIIFGGTNDFGHGDAPLGTPDDRTPDTFWGACHYLFETAIREYPDAITVICTPLRRLEEKNPSIGNGEPLSVYADIIRRVAEHYSLPVLDLWKISCMHPGVDCIRERYMPDGLHPSDMGHERIADRIIGFLSAL